MWLDSDPALAKRNVAGNMEDRVGGQPVQLEPIETKEPHEERMQGQRKTVDDEH